MSDINDTEDDPQERREASEELTDIRQRIALGMDVEALLRTGPGRYLRDRANAVLQEALVGLAQVDAEDVKAIRALQHKYQAGHFFLDWLEEAVQDGKQAEAAFRAFEAGD